MKWTVWKLLHIWLTRYFDVVNVPLCICDDQGVNCF